MEAVQHLALMVIVDKCFSNYYFNGTRREYKMTTDNDDLTYYTFLTASILNLYWNKRNCFIHIHVYIFLKFTLSYFSPSMLNATRIE